MHRPDGYYVNSLGKILKVHDKKMKTNPKKKKHCLYTGAAVPGRKVLKTKACALKKKARKARKARK